jgi:hypothetical protein
LERFKKGKMKDSKMEKLKTERLNNFFEGVAWEKIEDVKDLIFGLFIIFSSSIYTTIICVHALPIINNPPFLQQAN